MMEISNKAKNSVTKNDRFSAQVNWCVSCRIPVFDENNSVGAVCKCPLCHGKTEHLSSDLRPVFPEERLLLELLLEKEPFRLASSSVWNSANRYYIDGKSVAISSSVFRNADCDALRRKLDEFSKENLEISKKYFDSTVQKFIQANKSRFDSIKDDAFDFVQDEAEKFVQKNGAGSENRMIVSFSGGKDSTATADVVIKALANPKITHLFGNTTLEFPMTIEYAERYRKNHPLAEFRIAKNTDQNFYEVCKEIGPPARMMRWCCSMFKTGPITRVLNRKFGDKQILTFYGIRKNESVSRSKYSRVTENTETVKIQKQTVASPIFEWKDLDVWLYLLSEKVDFNDAYRLGYDRVGCWCCPNNNLRAQFLSRIYMSERSEKWRSFIVGFARQIGKPDAEEYVDSGKWKARQGGNGVAAAGDVKLKFTNCTSEEHSKIYQLTRAFDDSFLNMLVPFGILAPELGRKLIHETLILDVKTKVPIISVQPFNQSGFEHAVKVRTMNVEKHDDLQRMIGYQVRKFNACRKCLKCESVCRSGAISLAGNEYYINPEKCVHCKKCVTEKYLTGGCMMEKYLRTKDL
ncbi:phosphoadenosine phosphosulfate reductase family protein [Treponema succinifaciens]|uniref:phosphoadenosine phosphosulfate reductase domain-containing protein n=1 Tax=Treponema succinifaciens TaxID=167 RepID=UPI0023F8F0D0|nr:phosphoadenosine phosphosulfate reductase family protein [Treponema succinifaciens]